MLRFALVIAVVVGATECSSALAQGHSHHSHGHVSGNHSHHATHFGQRFGRLFVGDPSYGDYFDPYSFRLYVYDPYRFGSFDPPDLHDDPYFRERHRYDSKYPGRHRARRVVRRAR